MSFLHKIRERWECFINTLTLQKVIRLIFVFSGILLLCAGVIWLFYVLMAFIVKHLDALILGSSIIGGICVCIWHKGKQAKEKALLSAEQNQASLAHQEKQRIEDDYVFIRNTLFQVHKELADVTHLPQLAVPSGLDAPEHSVLWNGVYIHQYLIPRGNCTLSVEELQELYRTRIQQMLNRNEVAGLSQSMYVHTSGRRYPIIMLHSIRNNGSYYQFDYVFAGSHYCTILESIQAAKYHSGTLPVDTHDRDF